MYVNLPLLANRHKTTHFSFHFQAKLNSLLSCGFLGSTRLSCGFLGSRNRNMTLNFRFAGHISRFRALFGTRKQNIGRNFRFAIPSPLFKTVRAGIFSSSRSSAETEDCFRGPRSPAERGRQARFLRHGTKKPCTLLQMHGRYMRQESQTI